MIRFIQAFSRFYTGFEQGLVRLYGKAEMLGPRAWNLTRTVLVSTSSIHVEDRNLWKLPVSVLYGSEKTVPTKTIKPLKCMNSYHSLNPKPLKP